MEKFEYKIATTQFHTVEIVVPAHMIATIVADKLGLPVPLPGPECTVSDHHKCLVAYRAAENSQNDIPITLTREPPKPSEEGHTT